MSLKPEADSVSLSAPKVCSWSPSHWNPSEGTFIMSIILLPEKTAPIVKLAVSSEQFRNKVEGIFEQYPHSRLGPVNVADLAIVPVSPMDDNCNDGAMPAEPPMTLPLSSSLGADEASSASREPTTAATISEGNDEPVYRRIVPACSSIGTDPRYGEARYAPESEATAQVVCCEVGGQSSFRSVDGRCISQGDGVLKTYAEAVTRCSDAGMRLCEHQDELDESCGESCNLDGSLVWTRAKSGSGGEFSLGEFVGGGAQQALQGHRLPGHQDVQDVVGYLKDWRIDAFSLSLMLLCALVVWWCCCRRYRSRELLGQNDTLVTGPSPLNMVWMKAQGRPPGFTGEE